MAQKHAKPQTVCKRWFEVAWTCILYSHQQGAPDSKQTRSLWENDTAFHWIYDVIHDSFKQHNVHFLQLWSHERKKGTKAKYLFYLVFMMFYLFNNKFFHLILTFIAQELSTTLNMIQLLVARGKCVLPKWLAVILLAVAGKCSCKRDATPKPPSDGFGC